MTRLLPCGGEGGDAPENGGDEPSGEGAHELPAEPNVLPDVPDAPPAPEGEGDAQD